MTSLEEFEDTTLIERTLAGEEDCFAILMNRHAAPVKRHTSSMLRNSDETDDVVQDVILKTWLHLSSFRGESSFRSWMTRIAINQSLMLYRKRRSRPIFSPAEVDIPAAEQNAPDRVALRQENIRRVWRAAARLPEQYRQVLLMRDIEEKNSQETTESLGLTVGAVKSRLFRARAMLSVHLRAESACWC